MPRSRLEPGSFLGRTVRSYRSNHLSLVETRYESAFKSSLHSHEYAFCSFILEGACTQTSGRRPRSCATSSLGFHPAGEPHSDSWHEGGGRCLHLEFGGTWMERVRDYSLVLDQPVKFRAGMPIRLAERLYRELQTPDTATPAAIEGLALELVAEFARQSVPRRRDREPIWLPRVVEMLEARFRDHLTLEELGHEAGVHPVHLVTVFRRHLRCTPFDFLRQRRVAFAARQLLDTQDSLAQIGLDAGFAHQSHFCRVFKSVIGMTPMAFRDRTSAS